MTYLGLSEVQISLTLLSGPLCGAILQPYFGSWSDTHHSPWGRRKPFIFIGGVCTIISMLCLSWIRSILTVLLPSSTTQEARHAVLALSSALSVFSMYAAIQAVQVGMRALITDGCSSSEQTCANVWAGRYNSAGGVIGNLAAFADSHYRGLIEDEDRTILMDLNIFAAVSLIVLLTTSCLFRSENNETSAMHKSSAANRAICHEHSWLSRQLQVLKSITRQSQSIYLVQVFSWLGWFPFYFFAVA